jgi:hypothetical protein
LRLSRPLPVDPAPDRRTTGEEAVAPDGSRATLSVLAEVERPQEFLAQRVLEELDVTGGAKVEAKSLGGGELFGTEPLVTLEQLRDLLHVIVVEVVLRDLGRVETGVGLDLDHITGVTARSQILAAEITREVDHQRLIPQ